MDCITVDDEFNALNLINGYIKKTDFLDLKGSFQDPIKAVHFYEQNDVDLIFLDINMPELNGLQVMKSLNKEPLVIFITAYSEYAIDSFNFNVVDYLLKPITFERFLKAANKAYKLCTSQENIKQHIDSNIDQDFIRLKSNKVVYKILIDDIKYIEAIGNYVLVQTLEKSLTVYISLNQILSMLNDKFVRIHKSYIVNTNFISQFERNRVKIDDNFLPVGTTYRQYLKEIFKS